MSSLRCFYCSKPLSETDQICPHCQAPVEQLRQEQNTDTRKKRFILWFILLCIFCGVMMLWLPRDL